MDAALLALRVVVGVLLAAHGLQKLTGWFGGYGLTGTGGYLEGLGFHPGRRWAAAAGSSELAAGALLVAGLLTPIGAAAAAGTMFVAARTDHRDRGPWIFNGGWEYTAVIATVAVAIAAAGPGTLSVDRVLELRMHGLGWALGALGGALVASAATLASRTTPEQGGLAQPAAVQQPAASR